VISKIIIYTVGFIASNYEFVVVVCMNSWLWVFWCNCFKTSNENA